MQINEKELWELLEKRIEEARIGDYFLQQAIRITDLMSVKILLMRGTKQFSEKVDEICKILDEVYRMGTCDMERCYRKLLKNAPKSTETPQI